MDVIEPLITLIKETPYPEKIIFLVSLVACGITAIVVTVKLTCSVVRWVNEK